MKGMHRAVLAFALSGILFTPGMLRAQTSELRPLLTWRAVTYTPDFYTRKALPISTSDIIAAIDIIDRGRPADLALEKIYWYANDRLVSSGTGMTRISLTAPSIAGRGIMEVRVSIPEYRGGIAKTVRIPIVSPEAVIEAPYPGGRVRSSPFDLKAHPFFFNISQHDELSFAWKVSGREPGTYADPLRLRVSLDPSTPPRTTVPIGLRIENPYGDFEFGTANMTITYQP